LGRGRPEHLNDDRLVEFGQIILCGIQLEIFVIRAASAARHLGSNEQLAPPSSFHVDGEYTSNIKLGQEPGVIQITYGYSERPSPDSKQFISTLIHDKKKLATNKAD